MRLTLEDIGREAGVSRSTVSRVVNGQDSVRPEVRDRVRAVIGRTGFRPNASARSLASNRTGIIGLVIPSKVHSLFEDPYFGLLIRGVTRASNEAGTTLTLFLFESEDEEREVYPRVVGDGLVDGLIITATRMGDPLLDQLAEERLPFVVVGRPDRDDVSYVDVDNAGGARLAARHLCDLGYRRIGYLGAPTNTTAGLDRLAGFRDGLGDGGHTLDADLRVDGDFTETGGYRAMQRLIRRQPDAVFAASDTMAVGAMRALAEAGLDVPGDVALVGFDGMAASQHTAPPLTTVRQPVADTGRRAAELLMEVINGDVTAPVAEILPVELVVRESSGMRKTDAQSVGSNA